MRIFPPPLEIGDTEGFTPEKDLFGRAELAKGLTNLLGAISDPMVLAIDAQWGSGKTTFLKMWAGELRQRRFPVVSLTPLSMTILRTLSQPSLVKSWLSLQTSAKAIRQQASNSSAKQKASERCCLGAPRDSGQKALH